MKPYKRIVLTGAILTALAFTSSAIAQDAGVSATSTTPVTDARAEAKAKAEALRAENKAKIEAARAEAKAKAEALKAEAREKREELKKQREAFVLKQAQERFARAVEEAEKGIAAGQVKLAEAKAAALSATDKTSFEKARRLFHEARKIIEKSLRPLSSAPKVAEVTSKTPVLPEYTTPVINPNPPTEAAQ